MSVLTKIFVVLATVLAVLLVPLMIAYVNNTQHFKTQLDEANAGKAVAVASAQVAQAALARVQEGQSSALSAVNAENSSLQARIVSLSTDLVAAQTAKVVLENDLATKNAQLSAANSGFNQSVDITKAQKAQLETLQAKVLKTEQDFVEVSNALQEKTTALDTLTQQVRLLQEQLTDAQNELAKRQTQQVVATTTGAAPQPPVTIRGEITAVEAVGDQTFVAINVGKQDQVAEGMHFIIHSGDQYVGSLTITKVDLNSAAGRVTLKRGDITKDLAVMASAF